MFWKLVNFKVYNEIEIWRRLEHKNLIKLYQIIDDVENDKLFLVMQLADMGQLMKWDEETLKYSINATIFDFVKKKKEMVNLDKNSEREAVAKNIFKELGEGVRYLHKTKKISHRDIKIDNIVCKSDGKHVFSYL